MNTKFLLSSDNNNRNELLKKKIIHYYIANGDATIADLGREMDLSIPTVTKLVAELQDDGYILDFGKQETNGGRKPNIYGLNPASGYFVGVDMLKDKLNIAAIDFKGDKVQLEENIPYQLENTPASLEQFCKIIDDFIVSLPVERNKILAIGVNITGRVNPASGYSYSIFYFEEKPLAQILEERLQTKVFIENDSRAMTYGEYMKGVVQGEKNILFVNMAWGLGLGIIIDGNLYYGKSGFSGEFGHFCMFENEVLCHCGKKGCLETEVSGIAIENKMMNQIRNGRTTILMDKFQKQHKIHINDIIGAARNDDTLSIELIEEAGEKIGKSIAFLINIFNPEQVIIGGSLANAGDYLMLPLKSAVNKYSLRLVYNDTLFRATTLDDSIGSLGAAMLIRNQIISL